MMASMAFWDAANLDAEDNINRSIWTSSRAAQRRLADAYPKSPAGLLQAELGLPWVPDLAGSRWREPGSVFVVGSAYSPFIAGHAGRARSMQLVDYDSSVEPIEFQRRFVEAVVEGDTNYYGPLATLLEPVVDDGSQVVLLDLCRGCLIDRETGSGGDDAIALDPDFFLAVAEANWAWTSARLEASDADVIVVLGLRAEHVLLRLLHAHGFRMRVRGRPRHFEPSTSAITEYATGMYLGHWLDRETWWEVEHPGWDRRWRLLPVYHPAVSLDSRWDRGYSRTRRLLASMMGRPVPDDDEVQGLHLSERPAGRTTADKATWEWVLAASVPPVGRLLASHPQAESRTTRLVETLDLERLIVLGDVLFNKCRMAYLDGAASSSDYRKADVAWEWLEAGMAKRHTRPSGWTGAAKLLRDGAEEALAEVRALDIGRLAGVALRVVDGPYREANKRGIK